MFGVQRLRGWRGAGVVGAGTHSQRPSFHTHPAPCSPGSPARSACLCHQPPCSWALVGDRGRARAQMAPPAFSACSHNLGSSPLGHSGPKTPLEKPQPWHSQWELTALGVPSSSWGPAWRGAASAQASWQLRDPSHQVRAPVPRALATPSSSPWWFCGCPRRTGSGPLGPGAAKELPRAKAQCPQTLQGLSEGFVIRGSRDRQTDPLSGHKAPTG